MTLTISLPRRQPYMLSLWITLDQWKILHLKISPNPTISTTPPTFQAGSSHLLHLASRLDLLHVHVTITLQADGTVSDFSQLLSVDSPDDS